MKLFTKYHKGERQAQELAKETRQAEFNGQAISNSIIEGALKFISEQEYVVVSIEDSDKNIWISVLSGDRGFITAPNPKTVLIEINKVDINQDEVFWKTIEKNKKVGMLIIELASRRRIRINGTISKLDNEYLELKVTEAYPNCMKYIQRRHIVKRQEWSDKKNTEGKKGLVLSQFHKELIKKSDTFFIGSANPKGYLDASHRGGNPGFVEFVNETAIRIPDYKGNSMFNTFGNLILNDHAGVVFWDFEKGALLQMTGKAKISWENPGTEITTAGTGRFWEFEIEKWIEHRIGREFSWEFLDYSPHNP